MFLCIEHGEEKLLAVYPGWVLGLEDGFNQINQCLGLFRVRGGVMFPVKISHGKRLVVKKQVPPLVGCHWQQSAAALEFLIRAFVVLRHLPVSSGVAGHRSTMASGASGGGETEGSGLSGKCRSAALSGAV